MTRRLLTLSRHRRCLQLLVAGLWLWTVGATATASALPWEQERFDEDYRQQLQNNQTLPVWKQPLNLLPLLVGGSARLQYERSELFEPEDGVRYEEKYLQRYSFHLDGYLSEHSRLFLQLSYTDELKSNVTPSPVDENNLELHQGIYQFRTPAWDIRLGKQEIVIGEKRLFGAREGTNVRRTHTALWGQHRVGEHHISFLAGSPTDNRRGSWEDEVNHDERYYHLGWQSQGVGLGYYFYTNDDPLVGKGTAYRNMLALILDRAIGAWQHNGELYLQWGHDDDRDIRAWRYSGDFIRQLSEDTELVLAVDIASGGVSGNTLKTFDPMYMRGSYLSELSSFTASNLITLHPYIEFEFQGGLELKVESSLYWRYSDDDDLYGPGRFKALSANLDDAFVGAAFAVELEWEVSQHIEMELTLGRLFFNDDLVDQGIDHASQTEVTITYAF